jgi:hypothetical protein
MFSHKADGPLTVHIPRPAEDQPPWKKVAIIAAVGFIVGIAWPRLAGFRLGPNVPEASSAAPALSAPASQAPAAEGPVSSALSHAVVSAAAVPAVVASPLPAAPLPPGPTITVGTGTVSSCKTSDGDSRKGPECGKLPGLDAIVVPRLRKLADCPDVAEANGKLQLLLQVDFVRGWLLVDLGHGQSVGSPDLLLACTKTELAGAPVASAAHEYPRYSVAYSVTFGGNRPPNASASARPIADATEATALVVWEVAIVRDAPKTGRVVARLPRGTTLHLGVAKEGWYPVKYGDGFASDGWVYRAALGR